MAHSNGSAAVGLVPLDDVFRTHAQTANRAVGLAPRQTSDPCPLSSPPSIELREPHFGLTPRGTATLQWAIYPFAAGSEQPHGDTTVDPPASSTEFFAFVNRQRRDFGTNTITMNGTGFLSMMGEPELKLDKGGYGFFNFTAQQGQWWKWSGQEMRQFIEDNAMHYVVSTNGGYGEKDACVTAGGNTRLDVDGSRFMVDPPAGYDDFLRSIISQMHAACGTDSSGCRAKPVSMHYMHTMISTGADDQTVHADAAVTDETGHQVFLENCHSVAVCNASTCDYPLFIGTASNSYGKVLYEYIDKALRLGFDGIYHVSC